MEEEGEGSDLFDAVALFHCDLAEGGPGSFDVAIRDRVELDARLLEIGPLVVGFRITGPKSLITLLSPGELGVMCSSIVRFPSADEARAASRLVSTSLRFGTAAVKLESVEAELNLPLPLREGMLLVLTPRMGRPMLLC